ncbi:hypothetical protein C5C24_04690 [Rathayibacter sp. AY2B3]|uniref:aminoglycoside phosphotransferase family protein n=1 Tax=Rathayibacter sp. AY2B3 TaxID=2080569 RepID=UPI000CE76392|nr:aminoglycoside phosphotransferase family protein [Rathayibacter sp. AY2B3]PPG52504.1 hypothetical protein C5C24_04690 [Rathayibacter sp. AY2B3]
MTENTRFEWNAYLSSKGVTCLSVEVLHDQRNEVVRVRTDSGRELLLKRGTRRSLSGDGALLNEGLVYHLLDELEIADLAPRCILHDRNGDVLLLDYLQGGSARENWGRLGTDEQAWASLGMVLARIHAKGVQAPEWVQRLLGDFEELVPSAEPLQPVDLIEASSGQLQVVRALQSEPLIGSRLAELASPTTPTLIHGDARLDNILVGDEGEIHLIDFELSRIGDPLFDLGTLVGSVLEHVAVSTALEDEESASQFIDRVLRESFIQSRSIIAGYRAGARAESLELIEHEEFLARLTGFAGVYLLHRAGALAHQFYAETRLARLLTITGCTFVRNPSHMLRPLNLDASYNWLRSNWRVPR